MRLLRVVLVVVVHGAITPQTTLVARVLLDKAIKVETISRTVVLVRAVVAPAQLVAIHLRQLQVQEVPEEFP
jgi:hypothetical protein